uniref:Uncharacterized protein n=1 Tax=Arion vulgaris TaxID=1028688 RepID=A0A0B7ALX5_9EUPU
MAIMAKQQSTQALLYNAFTRLLTTSYLPFYEYVFHNTTTLGTNKKAFQMKFTAHSVVSIIKLSN